VLEPGATVYSGRVRGSPNFGRTLLSVKPVMVRIWSLARVSTIIPCAWPTGVWGQHLLSKQWSMEPGSVL
jgi:hypothetical protein